MFQLFVALVLPALGLAVCTNQATPVNSIKPAVAPGWQWAVFATGLNSPRSISFDLQGRMVVVERGVGITVLEVNDNSGLCVTEKSRNIIINSTLLDHGLAFDHVGKTIYASTSAAAFSWMYDLETGTASPKNTTVVTGMYNNDHNTRTLLTSSFVENMMYVSRGSNDNIDPGAAYLSSGRSQIKAFDMWTVPPGGYDFSSEGERLGWGLRNSVGIAEHPVTGGIYSVENSCDQYTRDGVDIHQDNPGEELNFHGTLANNTYSAQGGNYGYPNCFAAWNATELPNNTHLVTGSQFANTSTLDYLCTNDTSPRLTFEAHMAPLDIKFSKDGSTGYVTFHGSWDRTSPSGYKLSTIDFANGEPVAPADSTTSYKDIFYNTNPSKCPNNCFRPVGMAFDNQGRLYVSSDASGEIYVLMKSAATGTAH